RSRWCWRFSSASTPPAGMPSRPRLRLFGWRRASASYTAATTRSSRSTRSACSIQASRRSLTSSAIRPSPKLSCARRISIMPLSPGSARPLRPQKLLIELADRFDRLLEPLIVVQPPANLGHPLATHTELPGAAAGIAHRQDRHRMALAARAARAARLVANDALQQRAAQQLPGDRQIFDQLLTRQKSSVSIHSNK